jgi:hypothetical protein
MNLSTNERAFLKLLSSALFNNSEILEDFEENAEWEEIFTESVAQAMTALVFEGVSMLPKEKQPSAEFMEMWEEESMVSVMKNSYIMYAHKQLIDILNNNDIDCCIIKGAAVAVNYPKPSSRAMGDIDVFVGSENFEKARVLLESKGYEAKENYIIHPHDYKLEKDNVLVELHNELPGVPEGKKGEGLHNIGLNMLKNTANDKLEGVEFYKPKTTENGLIQLLHIINHIASGIGIRQICDWAVYVNNELTEEVWNNELLPLVKENKIFYFTKILTKMCCTYLGLPTEKCRWCTDADDSVCAELLRYILDNGNFGKKEEFGTGNAGVLIGKTPEQGKNVLFSFKTLVNLQNQGCKMWSAVQKYKILKCVAWAYLPVRFIYRILIGERNVHQLGVILSTAKNRYPFISKLKLYRE